MARTPKEAIVCIFDVSTHMNKGDPSHFESARQALEALVQQKLLVKPKDEMGLILVGTEGTDNKLAEELGGYDNITVSRDIAATDLDFLKSIKALKPTGTAGDLFDAVVLGLTLLTELVGKYDRRLFILTNAEAPMNDEGQVDVVLDKFREHGVKLDVIGIDFEGDSVSEAKAHSVDVFKQLAASLNGHVLPVHKALEIMSVIRSRTVTPTSKMRGSLDIGTTVKIPVWTFGKTVEAKLPTAKKLSTVAPAGSDGGVGLDRQYRSAGDLSKEIEPEDRVKAHRYGKELIPVSHDDEQLMKFESERCLTLLCFAPAARIPRHYFLSSVDVVVPEPGSKSAGVGIASLAHALQRTQNVAVVRYVKRKNAAPILAVLTPCIANGFPDSNLLGEDAPTFACLLLNQLPFAEDLRLFTFPSFDANPKLVPTADQLTAAANLINRLDLMTADVDSEGRRTEALKPTETFNPLLQRFYQWLAARALQPGAPMPPVDGVVKTAVEPDAALFAAAAPEIAEFKAKIPLTANVKARSKKRRFWGEGIDADNATTATPVATPSGVQVSASSVDVDVVAAKRKLAAGDGDVSAAGLFGPGVVNDVGSVDPVGNFFALLARRDKDMLPVAIPGLQKQIDRYVGDGSPAYRDKAIECLTALRKGCLENYEELAYNEYLRKLKREKSPGPFWDALKSHRECGLITSEESPDANISDAEAATFWDEPVPVGAPSLPTSLPATAVDDVFDNMD